MAGSIRLEMFYSQAGGNESFSGNTRRIDLCRSSAIRSDSHCQALSSTTTDALARTEASVDMFPAYSFSVRGVASCCAVRRTAAFCRRADAPGARCSTRGFRVSWGAADEPVPLMDLLRSDQAVPELVGIRPCAAPLRCDPWGSSSRQCDGIR